MSGSLNKVILIGVLGRDPEIRSFADGGRVANLSIATSERWKDRDSGERKERTEWHRVSVTNQALVGICEQYLHKGTRVCVEGQLETRKWQDKSGQDRYSTEVVLRPYRGGLVLLGRNGDQGQGDAHNHGYDQASGQIIPASTDDLDDYIPF